MAPIINALETRLGWPTVMLAGILLVGVAVLVNGLAALTGVTLVALGAAGALAERTPHALRFDWLLLHAMVYGSLYALFLGARLHASPPPAILVADFAGSLVVLAMLSSLLRRSLT